LLPNVHPPPPIPYLWHYQWRILEILSEAHVQPALFRDITQLIVVIPYRRFGTTHRSHLQDETSWVVPKRR